MTTTKVPVVTGSPTFCWQCMNTLQHAPGKGQGRYYAHTVTGWDGYKHRVHGDCLTLALADGCKLVKGEQP